MEGEVEFTDEFEGWWDGLSEAEQKSVARYVTLLGQASPDLPRPYADAIHHSKVSSMRELRVQHEGEPYRVLYAFNPKRTAVLLIAAIKRETPTGMKSSCRRRKQFMRGTCAN